MIYVAWLRGINVGGNTPVAMPLLKECFENLGYEKVKTYINSGNVVFVASEHDPRKLEAEIQKALNDKFSFDIKVVVRSLPEIEKMIAKIPKDWEGATDKKRNIIFLRHNIDSPKIIKDLNPKPDIDKVIYHPGTLLWSAETSNFGKSSMLKMIGTPIYKDMTIRNVNTVHKVHALMLAAKD